MSGTAVVPSAARGLRERARAELVREITLEARRQLVSAGPRGLSLRAVARALGMAPSALYRYFDSREDLLAVLVDEARAALEEQTAKAAADAAGLSPRQRWLALAAAVRDCALRRPDEYALAAGTGADMLTLRQPPSALRELLADGDTAGGPLSPGLRSRLAGLAAGTDPALTARSLLAWAQLLALAACPDEEFFGYAAEQLADALRLPEA